MFFVKFVDMVSDKTIETIAPDPVTIEEALRKRLHVTLTRPILQDRFGARPPAFNQQTRRVIRATQFLSHYNSPLFL